MAPRYRVFISHAGEDKAPLAVLIYEGLKRRGISAFFDERELQVGGDAVRDMDEAMRTALVGLFILSPEFALKYYPMLELRCFMKRAGLLGDGGMGSREIRPELIPVFYRLSVAGCKYASAFEEFECDESVRRRFDEKVKRGETSLKDVLEHLTLLAGRTGVENKAGIGNDDTDEMKEKRERLAEKICDEVTRVLVSKGGSSEIYNENRMEEECEDVVRATFEAPENPEEVVLDFSSASRDGEAETYEAEVLRKVLRNEEKKKAIALTGIGGVGKSCILRAVARHGEVKRRFPGGVYFISLGVDASVESFRKELLRVLRVSRGKRAAERLRDEDMEAILDEVRKVTGRRRSLVLVDDVWERDGVKAKVVSQASSLLSNEHGGMVLLTTRSASVASKADEVVHIKPREAMSELTRKILLKYAKFSTDDIKMEGVERVIQNLQQVGGGLPVCLAVLGGGVGRFRVLLGERAWLVYWEKIRNSAEDLLYRDVDDYVPLNTSLSVALEMLEENKETRREGWKYTWTEMYRSLCVMKKQEILPTCVLGRMWKMSREDEVWKVLEGFSTLGLGEIVYEKDGRKGLRVHDLLHDFAVSLASGENEVSVWNKRLLDGYICSEDERRAREWWSLKDDGYVYQNVCRHLKESGSIGELEELLLSAPWTNSRLEFGGLLAWKEDFRYCLEGMKGDGDEEGSEEKRKGLCLVRDAVVDSWLYLAAGEREQLGFQIHGRLQEAQEWGVWRYLESVRKYQEGLWLKPYRECFPRPGKGSFAEFLFPGYTLSAVAVYGEPACAVVGTDEGSLFVLNLEERRVVKRLDMGSWILKVAVSNDEKHILSFNYDNTLRWWNLENGVESWCVELHDNVSSSLALLRFDSRRIAFSRDCGVMVSACKNGALRVVNVKRGKMVWEVFPGFWGEVFCVAVSPDGSRVVAGGGGGSLIMWDVSGGTELLWDALHGRKVLVRCAAFSPDGQVVVSGANDETVRLWNATSGEQIGNPLTGHEGTVRCVTFSPDGKRIVSGDDRGNVLLWNVETGRQVGGPLREHFSNVRAIGVSKNGRFAVSVDAGSVQVSDLHEETSGKDGYSGDDIYVFCVAASWDEQRFVSWHRCKLAGEGSIMRIWDARSGEQIEQPLHIKESRASPVSSVAISPDSRYLICGMENGRMQLWDVASRAQVGGELRGHTRDVVSVAFSPDGQHIVSGSWDKTARMWNVKMQVEVGVSGGGARGVKRRRVSHREVEAIASTGMETILQHDGGVTFVSFSMDGSRIVSMARGANVNTYKICVWETSSGKLVCHAKMSHAPYPDRVDMKNNHVRCLRFDPRDLRQEIWRLDRDGSLIEISDDGNSNALRGPEGEGLTILPRFEQIVCDDRYVRLGADGPIIATLPAGVLINAWHYDASHGVLVTGLLKEHMLFSRFVR